MRRFEKPQPARAPAPDIAPATRVAGAGALQRLLALQGSAGNRATLALLARRADPTAPPVQAEATEVEEQEQDEVEEQAEPVGPEGGKLDEPEQVDDVLDAITEATRTESYAVEGESEQHTGEVRFVDGEVVPGVNSDFRTVKAIHKALSEGESAKQVTSGDADLLVAQVLKLQALVEACADDVRKASSARWAMRLKARGSTAGSPYAKPVTKTAQAAAKVALSDATTEWNRARSTLTYQANRLAAECQKVHEAAWARYPLVLGVGLMPASEVFKDRAFAGDSAQLTKYHTGSASDPIPIVWYKDANDYPALEVPNGSSTTTVAPFDSFTLGMLTFGVDAANRPSKGWQLRKVAHSGDRSNQQAFNNVLDVNGVRVQVGSGMKAFKAAGVDGDHVKDLGFGGADAINNYWPLAADINRRAFHGYNSAYLVNYADDSSGTRVGKTRAIGGLIGYWFTVKAFLGSSDGAIPAESGTPAAGLA